MGLEELLYQAVLDNCRTLLKVNVDSMLVNIYKFEGEIWKRPEEKVPLAPFVDRYMQTEKVFEEDVWEFYHLSDLEGMIRQSREEEKPIVLTYRVWREKSLVWMRMEFMIPKSYSKEHPEVLLFAYDMNQREADFFETCYIMSSFVYKVLKINLTSNEFTMVKELPAESGNRKRFAKGRFTEEVNYRRDLYVHPEDFQSFREHLKIDHIMQHFREGNLTYVYHYRRRIGSIYRWVKLIMLPSSHYRDDHMEFFVYIQDVHKELLHLLDMNSKSSYDARYMTRVGEVSEGYYENVLSILSSFTQKYVDFCMIDLQKDICIRYKLMRSQLDGRLSYVEKYSKIIQELKDRVFDEDARKTVEYYQTVEQLQKLLMDRMTIEYPLKDRSGKKYKTIIRKIDSIRGVPTKALCYTTHSEEEHRLKIQTFGNFEVRDEQGNPVRFARKQSKELFAYLIDRRGYPVSSKDLLTEVLEKKVDDLNAIKYVSTLLRGAMRDLEKAGYPDIIIKEQQSVRINPAKLDCDFYHLQDGDNSYWEFYHNEYMKEYTWAEETNAELLEWYDRG